MNVVVLASESKTTWMLINALKEDYPELKVAFEKPVSRVVLLKNRAKRIGYLKVFGQLLFLIYLQALRAVSRKKMDALHFSSGFNPLKSSDVNCTYFDSVNSVQCIEWLKSQCPDAVILNGTRIVSGDVLGAVNAVFLNTHCGITPAYRGVHGGYWALYQGFPELSGVTVHVVDTGIDTGDIVFQKTISTDTSDNFLTYPIKQYILGIGLMRKALACVSNHELQVTKREDLPSGIWLHPTIFQYLWALILRGIK